MLPAYALSDLETTMTNKALDLINKMTVDEKIGQLMNDAPGIDRLHIPSYNWWNEALHGVARSGRSTVFPQAIGLAATFDTSLVHRVADAVSTEGRAKFEVAQRIGNRGRFAGLTYWTPNINIFRDPRWGRGQETYGEDPYLTGCIGLSYVKGLQGEDPFYLKSAACAKHFAVHSGPEALRHVFNAVPSEKDLYETYLPAFEKLVKEGHVEAVMGAYNKLNGISASASTFLLTDLLRKKWGFTGHVVSDCDAVKDIYTEQKMAKDGPEAAAMSLKSGLDLNCGDTFLGLKEALERKLITEKDLDKALLPLFMTRLKLGILTPDDYSPYRGIPESVIASDQHAELAREAARKGIVLLKNDNQLLPLSKSIREIYITGPVALDAYALLGNYYGFSGKMSTFMEGIVNKVSNGTSINFKMGTLPTVANLNPNEWAVEQARKAPVCIVFLGLNGTIEGEEGDAIASPTKGDKVSLSLPEPQMVLLRKLGKDRTNKIITVVTAGSPVDVREISELSDAVFLTWYPGQEGGNALGDLLFGDASPSGRLPVTFPLSAEALPAFDDYSMQGRTYKYMKDNIAYPFGYGLTYSTITYGNLVVEQPDPKKTSFSVKVTLENRGKYAVEEVPQLYVKTPGSGVTTPLNTLIGFRRVPLLPGERKEVSFQVGMDQLNMVMEDGKKRLLKGSYTLTVSGAAPSERTTALNVPQCSWNGSL